jgi:tetratricopeptide (TPR) repeat protein
MRYVTVLLLFPLLSAIVQPCCASAMAGGNVPGKIPASELVAEAGIAYRNGEFQKALGLYTRVREMGFVGGDLFYNIGNCYYRLGKKGMAVLNYERAKIMMPGDPDLGYNLGYVREQLEDKVNSGEGGLRTLLFWLDSVNVKEAVYAFVAANFLFWGLVLLYLFFRKDVIWYLLMTGMFFWAVSALSAGIMWHDFRFDSRAVIVSPEAEVLSGPAEGDTLLFRLHEGTVAREERREGEWSLVRISESRRGWTESRNLELINPDIL